ncbi:MAG: efflux RND transporter periplasmic adaptor subunit [Candidatus Kapaibacteriota bacterium]
MINQLKKVAKLMFLFIIAGTLIQSCGNNKKVETKSMEQIRKEEGVPVKVMTLQFEDLRLQLNYLSTLEGYRQSVVTSMVGDKVQKFTAKVGTAVKEGQIVVEFPTNNPALQFEQAKLSYENFKKMYDRMGALLAGGETSQQNFDNTETQYLVAKRNYESLKQMLFVESPISGLIVEKNVEEGQKVKNGDKLFTVAQIDRVKAIFWVSYDELQYIKNGMEVNAEINGKNFKGRISEVALAEDQMRRAFKIEAEIPNPKHELKVGMSVNISFDYYHNPQAIVIPTSALAVSSGKNYVYLTDGTTAIMQEVKLGKTQGDKIEIISGLKPNDRLIYQGISLLSNGVKIKILE